MSLPTLLRPARAEDCRQICEVHRLAVRYSCAQSYTQQILEAWLPLLTQDSYLETLISKDKTLWVIEYEGGIRGFFQLDFAEAQMDALYVLPFLHNRGLGTALLQRAEQLAIRADLSILSLYASKNSVSFYELNGYLPLGNAAVPLNLDVHIPCTLMRKHLFNRTPSL